MVRAMGQYLLDHCDSIAQLPSRESGKPYWEAKIEIEGSAGISSTTATRPERWKAAHSLGRCLRRFYRTRADGNLGTDYSLNYPVEMAARSICRHWPRVMPALSNLLNWTRCPRSALRWQSMLDAPAAVQILCGVGSTAGAALASHKDIDQIVFTGSVATGTAIATAARRI